VNLLNLSVESVRPVTVSLVTGEWARILWQPLIGS
jgi:hypothetical protein